MLHADIECPTLITNLENLPADVSRITTKFVKWYYDDEGWTGFPLRIPSLTYATCTQPPIFMGWDLASTLAGKNPLGPLTRIRFPTWR